ncbi:probable calcium-binding protein CML25 [Solanum tuberosum]|uniref:Calcium-binding pollen allergen n=2 Tax=Solanum tuberosum TaxID=4113 RepID=M1AL49_SOLTU|nr:PREDICTED: probable calcium-binding protein CML25 [Solanum tuberosum]
MGLIKSLFNRKKKNDPTPANSPPVNSPIMIEEELQQVFNKFDINGDGKISFSELGFIMASLGTAVTEEESIEMINEVDGDGDGFIDLSEFIELNTKNIDSDEVTENLKDAFSVFDVDKNGSISAEELQKVMKSTGEECSLDECRKMIGGVDCDGDGMIDFEEFKVMMIGKRKEL